MARRIIQAVLEPSTEPFDPSQRYLTFKFYDPERNAAGPGGPPGMDAYQVWLAQGNTGTVDDYLASLKGAAGAPGADGAPGIDGADGAPGADGTPGADGAPGLSAYQVWLEQGNSGTVNDYLASLKGDKGDIGLTGPKGDKGDRGDIGPAGNSAGNFVWYDEFTTDRLAEYDNTAGATVANGVLNTGSTAQRDLFPKGVTAPTAFAASQKITLGGAHDILFGLAHDSGAYFVSFVRQADGNMIAYSWYNGVYTALAQTGIQGVAGASGQIRWFKVLVTGRRASVLFFTADPNIPTVAAAQTLIDVQLPDPFVLQLGRLKPFVRLYAGGLLDHFIIQR